MSRRSDEVLYSRIHDAMSEEIVRSVMNAYYRLDGLWWHRPSSDDSLEAAEMVADVLLGKRSEELPLKVPSRIDHGGVSMVVPGQAWLILEVIQRFAGVPVRAIFKRWITFASAPWIYNVLLSECVRAVVGPRDAARVLCVETDDGAFVSPVGPDEYLIGLPGWLGRGLDRGDPGVFTEIAYCIDHEAAHIRDYASRKYVANETDESSRVAKNAAWVKYTQWIHDRPDFGSHGLEAAVSWCNAMLQDVRVESRFSLQDVYPGIASNVRCEAEYRIDDILADPRRRAFPVPAEMASFGLTLMAASGLPGYDVVRGLNQWREFAGRHPDVYRLIRNAAVNARKAVNEMDVVPAARRLALGLARLSLAGKDPWAGALYGTMSQTEWRA